MDSTIIRRKAEDTIRLNAVGQWYYGEYPILHERTTQFLHKNIARDEQGQFYLTGEDKPVYFTVDDVPYHITKVEKTIAGFLITLTDESIELLDPETLWTQGNESVYCLVKGGEFGAKFAKNAYYDLAKHIEPAGAKFTLIQGSKRFPIDTKRPKILDDVPKPVTATAKLKKAHAKRSSAKKASSEREAERQTASRNAPKKVVKKVAPKAKVAPKKAAKVKSKPVKSKSSKNKSKVKKK